MNRKGVVGGLSAAVITLWLAVGHAQPEPINLEGLELVPAGQVPFHGSFWSVANPNSPPCPAFTLRDLGIEAPVYSLGSPGLFIIDDRDVDYGSLTGPLTSSGDGDLRSPPDYGCGLYLDISGISNNASSILLTMHNTRLSQTYTIWSLTNLALTNWVVETNVLGAGGDFTETVIAKSGRPALFFKASESRDYSLDTNSTFTGLSYSDIQIDPPDSMGAVGPNHFIELLNCQSTEPGDAVAIAVYDKSGQLVAKTNTLDFFRVGTYPTGPVMADPRILYDHQSQRWVACAIDGFGSARALLAISTSDSPTNLATGWTRYVLQIHREGTFSDFTTLGLDANGLYVTAVMRNGATNLGHTIMAIKKPEIYAGTLITNRLDIYSTNTLPVWTIQPAVNFDDVATNGYAWFVAKGPPDLSTNYQGGAICYRRLQWFGTNAAWAETNWVVLSNTVPSYRNYYDLDGTNLDVRPAPGSAVFAPQAGNLAAIDLQVVGSRLAMTVIRNGFLWTCQAIGLSGTNGDYTGDQSGAAVDRSAAQWLKLSLNVADGALSLHEHGRIYDSVSAHPYYYCFPSLMVNCIGDMVMGFSGTSAVTNISAFYIWRTVNGAKPDMPRLIRLGTTYFNPGYPWGDFSATTLDPTDDWAFWTVQEYADPAGDPDDIYPWRTVIARIKPAP